MVAAWRETPATGPVAYGTAGPCPYGPGGGTAAGAWRYAGGTSESRVVRDHCQPSQ